MAILDSLFQKLASLLGKDIQPQTQPQAYRDYDRKGDSYSVECEISESLADLMLMFSTMPISGDNQRAKWLDENADSFFQNKAKMAASLGFMTGDCIIVPAWNGRNIQNIVIDADNFSILETMGDEITAVAYVVDTAVIDSQTYKLMQAIELIPYEAMDGSKKYANRYRMFVARNDSIINVSLSAFPNWAHYDKEWSVYNVDKLLIGRFRSQAINPDIPNSVKGAPICYGASEPIREIHYLLDQMHNEYGLSEKMIIADKRFFKKEIRGNRVEVELPRGRERVFATTQSGSSETMPVTEWSPDIRYESYLAAIDKQEKLVERAVGVSSGILSEPNNINYENVDNVRKSQQKTMSFISTARTHAEKCLTDLVYAWNILANHFEITPMGEFDINFDWSNEYVETFHDRQNAILAGQSIGATDAVDYRMYVMDESPETAREKVEEIQAAKRMVSGQLQVIEEGVNNE